MATYPPGMTVGAAAGAASAGPQAMPPQPQLPVPSAPPSAQLPMPYVPEEVLPPAVSQPGGAGSQQQVQQPPSAWGEQEEEASRSPSPPPPTQAPQTQPPTTTTTFHVESAEEQANAFIPMRPMRLYGPTAGSSSSPWGSELLAKVGSRFATGCAAGVALAALLFALATLRGRGSSLLGGSVRQAGVQLSTQDFEAAE